MNVGAVILGLEGRIETQLRLVGDPTVEEAGRTLLDALQPALREAALSLVQQAVDEVSAQLPDHTVEVVLDGSDPVIRVRAADTPPAADPADLDARITLRLPGALKELLEGAADLEGDSVNAYIVKALNRVPNRARPGTRIRGEYEL